MTNDLKAQLQFAVDDVFAPVDAGEKAVTRVRRHRRVRAASIAGAALVAVTVTSLLLVGGSTDSSLNVVTPIGTTETPSTTPGATKPVTVTAFGDVNGVSVTWLPSSLTASSPTLNEQNGHRSIAVHYFPANVKVAGSQDHPTVAITVTRGYTVNLQALTYGEKKWVTIRGHRGLLQTFPSTAQSVSPEATYVLNWVAAPGILIQVVSGGPLPSGTALRVAEGLVVGPPRATAPADTQSASAAIRQSLNQAFTGGTPIATTLSAIVDGEQLRSAIEHLRQNQPEMARTIRITAITGITFVDSTHAEAAFNLTFRTPGVNSLSESVGMLFADGRWKISQYSYCTLLALQDSSCS